MIMGKLKEAIAKRLASLGSAKAGTVEEFVGNPSVELEKIRKANDVKFIMDKMSSLLNSEVKVLDPAALAEYMQRGPSTEEKLLHFADELEKHYESDPEKLDQLTEKIEAVDLPSPEEQVENKLKGDIDEMRKLIRPDDPEAKDKNALLDQVLADTMLNTDETQKHINDLDNYIQPRVDSSQYAAADGFFAGFDGGSFAEKLPKSKSMLSNLMRYEPESTKLGDGGLTTADLEKAGSVRPELDPDNRKLALDIIGEMQEIGEQSYKESGAASPETGRFPSEQGTKGYAFLPLHFAYSKIEDALRKKDFAALKKAHEEHRRLRGHCDKMMQLMGRNKTPLCPGNVNSTRIDALRVYLPPEYTKDFVTHSKVNGLYLLYALSRNLDVPVEQILDDPVGVMTDGAKKFIKEEGVDSHRTTADKLLKGLSEEALLKMRSSWGADYSQSCLRGFDALASMEPDPEKRKKITGASILGSSVSSAVYNEYAKKVDAISSLPPEKIDQIYYHAALIPEDQFSFIEAGEHAMSNDWLKNTGLKGLVGDLRTKGNLDYAALLDRTDRILEAARKAKKESGFNAERFARASQRAFHEIIRTATPGERVDPGFAAFRSEVLKRDLKAALPVTGRLERNLGNLMKEKKGWFLSGKDSDEHQRMVIANRKLQYKLKQLNGEPIDDLSPDDLKALEKLDLGKMIRSARNAAYEYCRLKTDNGHKESFRHEVGADRYQWAKETVEDLDRLAELYDTQDPAIALLNKTRMDILHNRSSKDWTEANYQDAAAKALYGMFLIHSGKSYDEQRIGLKSGVMKDGIRKIRQDPAFQRMISNMGPEKMADAIVLGDLRVTNAFIQARNDLEHENRQLEAEEHGLRELGDADDIEVMTVEDKKAVLGEQGRML